MESPLGGDLQRAPCGAVDDITDAVSGLELYGANQKRAQEMTTPASQARPRARPRQGDDKENANTASKAEGITPSRLSCFKELRDELTCAVCLDVCVRPCTTPCGHNYCRSCLRRNLELNRPCPKCRASLPPGFALNINTTLWNMIQRLFPAEVNGKPLTPPPSQLQQPATGHAPARRPGASANGNPAAAPFRPPRFTANAAPQAQAPFTGLSSSRANAAAASVTGTSAALLGGGGMGLASFYGRSVSGPRLQHPLHATTAAGFNSTVPAAYEAAEAPSSGVVELGMRAPLQPQPRGGGGLAAAAAAAAARRERRRSRSAERWDGETWPLAGTATGDVGAGTAVPSSRNGLGASASRQGVPLPASTSRLMELLSEGAGPGATVVPGLSNSRVQRPTCTAAAAKPTAAAPAGSGLGVNPFIRALRPVQTRSSATASSGSTQQAAIGSTQQTSSTLRGAGSSGSFTASQRAHIGACSRLAAPSAAGASGGASAALTCAAPDTVLASSASAPVPFMHGDHQPEQPASSGSDRRSISSSYFGDSGSTRSSPISTAMGPGAGPLDDVSALELLPEDLPPLRERLQARVSAPNLGQRLVGSTDVGEDQATRVARGRRSDTGYAAGRDQGAARLPAAQPPAAITALESAAVAASVRRMRLEDCDVDDEITLEGLDVLSPAGPELNLRTAHQPSYGVTRAVAGEGPAARSPIWEELDNVMAAALQPIEVSPPSLPRLHIRTRQQDAPPPAAPSLSDQSTLLDISGLDAGTADTLGGTVAAGCHGVSSRADDQGGGDGRPAGQHFDPDLHTNYDGEDPSAADTFFTSPFFDRSMLWDSSSRGDDDRDEEDQEALEAEHVHGASDAGGGAAGGTERGPRQLESAFAMLVLDGEGRSPEQHLPLASAEPPPQLPQPHMPELRSVGTQHAPNAPSRQTLQLVARESEQSGGRDCPIEILSSDSDSDDDARIGGAAELGDSDQSAATAAARPSRRVVPGLRRPRRAG